MTPVLGLRLQFFMKIYRYSYQTSFGQKYDHFSLLCKQMDIYLRKVYIVRNVTSAPTFLV